MDYRRVARVVNNYIASRKTKTTDTAIYRFLIKEIFDYEEEVEEFLLSDFGGFTPGQIAEIKRIRENKNYLNINRPRSYSN